MCLREKKVNQTGWYKGSGLENIPRLLKLWPYYATQWKNPEHWSLIDSILVASSYSNRRAIVGFDKLLYNISPALLSYLKPDLQQFGRNFVLFQSNRHGEKLKFQQFHEKYRSSFFAGKWSMFNLFEREKLFNDWKLRKSEFWLNLLLKKKTNTLDNFGGLDMLSPI